MGVFRDYFKWLYDTYLKRPIDGLKGGVEGLKTGLIAKLSEVKVVIEGLSSQVTSLGTTVVTGLVDTVKGPLEKVHSKLSEFLEPITSIVSILFGFMPGYNAIATMKALKDAHTKDELNSIWDVADTVVKQNSVAVKVYKAVGKELDAQGLGSPANIASGFIGTQIANAIWAVEAKALPKIMEWVDSFATGYKMKTDDVRAMKSLANSGEFGLNAVVNFMLGVTLYPAVMSSGEPAWLKIRQEAYKALPVTLLDARTLVSLKHKEMIDSNVYNDQLGKLGFDTPVIDLLERDYQYYPAPTDFIRFAVRETFQPAVVEKYGYDDDFPTAMVPHAKKAGMSEEWFRHYWRAHWEIPSPRQGYEMLHRRIITEDELRALLIIDDYAPGWVDALKDISYRPITRVDLRRFYQDGVIDETRVYEGFLDLGYNDENAMLSTQWVVKSVQEKDRDLSKAEIMKSFRIGETSKERAIIMLGEIRYTEQEALFIIAYEEYRLGVEERKEEIETIIAELIEGRYTVAEVKSMLAGMDVSIKQQNKLVQKAERIIRKRYTLPSKDDCMRWFNAGIIDENAFKGKLFALHYSPEDIDRYLKEVLADI